MPETPELPPIADEPISLVLLAYNARNDLQSMLESWNSCLLERGKPFEIILVDDGSPDGTGAHAEELAATMPIRVLRHDHPRGEGAALRTGLAAARHPLVVYALCRPDYRPEFLRRVMDPIDQVHLVTVYRAGRRVPLLSRILGAMWRGVVGVLFSISLPPLPGWLGMRRHFGQVLARVVFGIRIRDAGCPYRVLRREILGRIPIQSPGTFAQVELLAMSILNNRALSAVVHLSM